MKRYSTKRYSMLFVIGLIFFLQSCTHKAKNEEKSSQTVPKIEVKPEVKETVSTSTEPSVGPNAGSSNGVVKVIPSSNKKIPHLGVIFSAGGALTWGHIGIIKELSKYRFPIISMAGTEWAAPVAAVYAQNLSANEVEWEMSKFKDLDQWQDFTKAVFEKKTVAGMKASFVCPSINLKSQTLYLLNRGNLDQFIPFCIPSFGLALPYGDSVASLGSVRQLVQHLRANGAQKIILISVLGAKSTNKKFAKNIFSAENQLWIEYKQSFYQRGIGIDEYIEVSLNDYAIDDFDRRREIIQKAADLSYNQVQKLAQKFGL